MHVYLRLRVHVKQTRPVTPASPQPLPAPLVRFRLGTSLIERFCAFGKPLCEPKQRRRGRPARSGPLCKLADSCPYGVLHGGGLNSRRPYAIHVVPEADRLHRTMIELTLFGPAWRLYPWLLLALQQALAGDGGEETRYEIAKVERVGYGGTVENLCQDDLRALSPAITPDQFSLTSRKYIAPQPVAVVMLSPTRLIDNGRLVRGDGPVPLALLLARILDRFQGVYGESASAVLGPAARATIAAAATEAVVLDHRTEWVEAREYSALQDRRLSLGGKLGRLLYGESAACFLPLLRAGEILHVGKNPTFGCGRIQVETGG